ncbi:probable DNA helicase II homolog [Filimonas sp.]|nr:probable DNA helicase II homolog [Filimonas sp.]
MNREELNQKFESIYNGLNPEQRKAVDTIQGPVLVIAGPGTGKTQILSARIGKILLETDYLPDNILCLTYTDAGRVAMRKRLQEMIGADAYRVNIHTFHSFCNQVIQENVSYFNKNILDPVSDLERIDFIRQIIDGFKKENPLKRYRGDVYYEIGRLNNLFSTMKKEGWTSAFIKEKIKEYCDDLPNRDEFIAKRKTTTKGKTFEKGDLRTDKIDEEIKKISNLNFAADAFDEYQNIMHKHNRYDFDDMINWVINVLQTNENLLLDYQEKYQFLLVDEFQDTSGTQNQLVNLLCRDVEQPNIFVVGDDDQSIYRFQGANVENIQDYKDRYSKQLTDVVLKSNYRSTQKILDLSRSVIGNNTERLCVKYPDIEKELVAAHNLRLKSVAEPELHVYENTFQEMVGVTNQIFSLIAKGVRAEKIAVIYKENKWGDELIKFFKEKHIPFYSKRKENLFQIPLSKKILTILRYIAAEKSIPYSADDVLFEILHFDLYDIPASEIAKASVHVNDIKYEKKTSLRTYFQDWIHTANRTLFQEKPHEKIIEVTTQIEKWIKDSFNCTVLQLVENVMLEGMFLSYALNDTEHKLWNMEVLRSLMDFVKEETHRNPDYTLASLIEVIDLMAQEELSLPLYPIYGNENGVNLLTAHGSKGLEFEYVFLINATSSTWEGKKAPNFNYIMPDTLFHTIHTNDKNAKEEEQRRLFFVAVTRAEEYLYISWSKKDEKEKPLEPSQFIAEITDKIAMQRMPRMVTAAETEEFLKIYLLRNKQPMIRENEQQFIQTLLSKFEMNATALNNYLNCPLRFYYQNLIRVPSGRSEASTFGSAVHHALEKLFDKMKKNNDVFPPIEVFIDDFKWYMNRYRESFTPEALKRRLDYGVTTLTALYEKNINSWEKVVMIERVFKNIVIDKVPVKGMLDKLEFDYNHVTIVDYKTGNPKNSKDKLKPPTAAAPLGGDYWRQGVFYKLLVEAYKLKDYKVTMTVFQFVEPNDSNEYISVDIIPTEDDLETVRAQVKDTWLKIQNHDFYTGCGKEDCSWCNFVKDNKQYVMLKEMGDETGNDEMD